jgi:hypothetical protein
VNTIERIGNGGRTRNIDPDEVALNDGPVRPHAAEENSVIGIAGDYIAGAANCPAQYIGARTATEFDP